MRHVREQHQIHVSECRRCDRRLFYDDANLARHNTVVHRRKCIYLNETFPSTSQVRQHIVTTHSSDTCHFCGNIYSTSSALYIHQKQHCRHKVKCSTCDREFLTLVQCNTHMSAHISRISACLTEQEPSM